MPWGKREPGPREEPKGRCGYTWSTRPPPNQVIRSVCYDHRCGLIPRHPGSHVCMVKWECGETK